MSFSYDHHNAWVLDSNIRSVADIALLSNGATVFFTPLYLMEVSASSVQRLSVYCQSTSLRCIHVIQDDQSLDGFYWKENLPAYSDDDRRHQLAAFDSMLCTFGDTLKANSHSDSEEPLLPPNVRISRDPLSIALWTWMTAVFTVAGAKIPLEQKARAVGIKAKIRNGNFTELRDIAFLHAALGLRCGLFTRDKLLRECAAALSTSNWRVPLLPEKKGETFCLPGKISFESSSLS